MPIILITGATSGIGKATALQFAQAGYKVIVTGRRKERLDALVQQILETPGGQAIGLCFDIRDRAKCMEAVENLPEGWKEIDILLNNAGGALGRDRFDVASLDDWDNMIDTNVKGLMYITKAVIPAMKARKTGHIINMGSIAGKEVYELGNAYNAAEFAVDAFSKAMRIDLLPFGIKVSQILPGAVETEFSLVRFKGDAQKAAAIYAGYQPLTAEDIAGVVYYVATLPGHVCINDLVITPTAQANSYYVNRGGQ